MKRILHKLQVCCLLILCLSVLLVGCNDKKTNTNKPAPSRSDSSNEKDPSSQKTKKGLDIADFDSLLSKEIEKDDALQIDKFDWNICAFQLEQKNYTLPFSYERIKENWTFSLSDYGLDKNFKLEPLTKTSDTIELKSEGKPYTLKVGFYNPYSTPVSLDQTKIWSLEVNIATPELDERTLENDNPTTVTDSNLITGNMKPELILPNGIQMHSSIASILLAYGNPENTNIHNTETGYYEFHYQFNYNIFLTLVLDEQEGLVKFNYKHFPSGAVTEMPEKK